MASVPEINKTKYKYKIVDGIKYRRLVDGAAGPSADELEYDVKDGVVLKSEITARHRASGFNSGLEEFLEGLYKLVEWNKVG